jgi:hypothetical protein
MTSWQIKHFVDNSVIQTLDILYARVDTAYINQGRTKGANQMQYQIRLHVKGCTNEQYAEVALRCLRNEGINGQVVRITKTRKGAVVTVAQVA